MALSSLMRRHSISALTRVSFPEAGSEKASPHSLQSEVAILASGKSCVTAETVRF